MFGYIHMMSINNLQVVFYDMWLDVFFFFNIVLFLV